MGCRHLKGVGSWEIRAGRPASGAKAGVVSLLESRHFPGHFGALDPLGVRLGGPLRPSEPAVVGQCSLMTDCPQSVSHETGQLEGPVRAAQGLEVSLPSGPTGQIRWKDRPDAGPVVLCLPWEESRSHLSPGHVEAQRPLHRWST